MLYWYNTQEIGPTLKALKFVRILKMVRAIRFVRKLDALEERDTTGALGSGMDAMPEQQAQHGVQGQNL